MSLEKYSVEKLIGKGSYGEVFLAKHKKDKRTFVVKKVSLQKASERERKAAELEAQLLSQLRHPNIVSYRESFQGNQGFLYIVMNYCEGGDLYTKLKAQKPTLLGEDQIVQWFVQIAMALQYMHEKHILHRDLKTQNIFLTRSKIIKLGDLGICKVLETSSDMATTLIGTPYYMSPELFSNKPYNHKSDVWALGCCLYEMCTLRHAFNAKDMSSLVYKILKGKTPPLPKQYSSDLCSIISSMLNQDPTNRPSASKILRHPYIKRQIAKFLEGTKSRQNRKTSSGERKVIAKQSTGNKPPLSSYSDSGYGESDMQSIATVSAVDCIIEDNASKLPGPSAIDHQTPVEKAKSASDVGQASENSSHSLSPSTEEKYPTEVSKQINGVADAGRENMRAGRERMREAVKKSVMPKPRKSLIDKKDSHDEIISAVDRKGNNIEIQTPVRRVRSAGSSRTQQTEAKPPIRIRPLPRPPPPPPRPSIGEAPMSKSPRARRRYKILNTRTPSHEEEDDDDDKSTASVESDKSSSHSVSESSNISGLTARERRRLKLRTSGSPLPSPSASYNTPPLPSPKGIIADIQRKKSQDHGKKAVGSQKSRASEKKIPELDCVDGPPRKPLREMDSGNDDSGSDLEEVSLSADEPSSDSSRRRQSEVSSLISALDSTLKLDDLSVDRVSPEIEDDPMDKAEVLVPSGASPTMSGRLRSRIERLKLECLQGIGEEMLRRAYNIIDSVNEDAVEDELVKVMGRENFDRFGGPIWQLKFCESFRIG